MEFWCNLDDVYDKIFIDNLANEENNFDKILDKKNLRELFDIMVGNSEFLNGNTKEFLKLFDLFEYNFKNIFGINERNDYLKLVKKNIFK